MLRVEQAGDVLRLVLDRPEAMNALTSEMRLALLAGVQGAVRDAQTRVVVITGEGRGFCAGQDLREMTAASDVERVLAEEYEPLIRAIVDTPIPVIAAVNGVAAGAGASLALTCDVVIAAESAHFVQAFSRIGLVPDAGATFFLPRQVGLARAMGAVLFAEPVSARQAADWGMIWQAVPDADFERVVAERAAAMANGPTLALAEAKRLMHASMGADFAGQLAREAASQARAAAHPDFAEGVAAFHEKRPARFSHD